MLIRPEADMVAGCFRSGACPVVSTTKAIGWGPSLTKQVFI